MGLAVYNSIILDLHFPTACYKKLLSPPVIPQNLNHANVGVWKFGIDDLAEVMPVSFATISNSYFNSNKKNASFTLNWQIISHSKMQNVLIIVISITTKVSK